LNGVFASIAGGKLKNAQLTVSHGCRPYTHGAWCSPGYWKNAEAAAWTLASSTKLDYFNTTVVPDFYATASGANPTLGTVLTTPAPTLSALPRRPTD
jgi:hypothetical protein